MTSIRLWPTELLNSLFVVKITCVLVENVKHKNSPVLTAAAAMQLYLCMFSVSSL